VAARGANLTARLCLKARPTPAQLADRLRPIDGIWPDGAELYLSASDLRDVSELEAIADRLQQQPVPSGFAWLIEGPVDSLDGEDFDVTRESAADYEVVRRLAWLAERIGAKAVNIHVIAPSSDISRLTLECRTTLLETSVPFIAQFVEQTREAGAVPTVENMPPVLRMRRSDFAFTPIGMASGDLRWLVERVDGLRVMPDTSHAGLYLNARHGPGNTEHAWGARLQSYLRQLPPDPVELLEFVQALPQVENAQVSNAAGILGEGLPYAEGDFSLDPTIRWLGAHARHIVTETLEHSNDNAVHMRDALRQMRAVID
jgi:hypothetical protein